MPNLRAFGLGLLLVSLAACGDESTEGGVSSSGGSSSGGASSGGSSSGGGASSGGGSSSGASSSSGGGSSSGESSSSGGGSSSGVSSTSGGGSSSGESSSSGGSSSGGSVGPCDGITPTVWTANESQELVSRVIAAFARLKRENDALIDQRGVGRFVGSGTQTWQLIAAGDRAAAEARITPYLTGDDDPAEVVAEIEATTCIGRVYRVLDEVYTSLGRGDEWDRIEACGRAHDSIGPDVQRALIQSGWPAPTLGLVSDAEQLPGSPAEVALHQHFLSSAASGVYYGVPVSTTSMMRNFLPSPGSSTPLDTSVFDAVGDATFLAFAILHTGYHVPLVVPGRLVPADLSLGSSWNDARAASDPFVLESHSYREAWDKTNFEIRPLRDVIRETFDDDVVYATGTLLFAPGSSYLP